jgi:hypothetical protein
MNKIRITLLSLMLFPLIACQDNTTETTLNTYHQRLSNVLDVTNSPLNDSTFIHLPESRDLQWPIEETRLSLLNAYELRACGLFQLIADRNSVLGKLQDKTRQLKYEILLINGLKYCATHPDVPPKLQTQLKHIQEQKQTQLTLHLHNMLLTDTEWRKQFAIHPKPFENNKMVGFTENHQAILLAAKISQSLSESQDLPNQLAEELTTHQAEIYPYRYFGRLFYSMVRVTDALNQITQQLTQHQNGIYCGKQHNQKQAEYLTNVFYRYFIDELQPYLVKLDRQYQTIQPDLNAVFFPLKKQPIFTAYYRFYIGGDVHEAYRQAIFQHQQFWRGLFKRCDLQVGQNRHKIIPNRS